MCLTLLKNCQSVNICLTLFSTIIFSGCYQGQFAVIMLLLSVFSPRGASLVCSQLYLDLDTCNFLFLVSTSVHKAQCVEGSEQLVSY